MATRLSDSDMAVAAAYASGEMYRGMPQQQQREPRVSNSVRPSDRECVVTSMRPQGAVKASSSIVVIFCCWCRRAQCALIYPKRRAICRTLMTCK